MRPPRFPPNDILTLLDVHRTHNLAESTSFDLIYADLLDDATLARLRDTPIGYGTSQGLPELRAQLGTRLGVSPDHILLTAGAGLALFLLGLELVREGDEALIVTPCFPPSIEGLAATGGTVRTHTLRFDDRYALDPRRLLDEVSDRTTLVSLATPQNPSGVAIDREAVETFARELASRRPSAFVIVDETYREAAIEGEPTASCAGLAPNVITTASLSKAHGAPGLRTGWLITHNTDLIDRLRQAKINTTNSLSIADEILALRVMERSDEILAERRALLRENLGKLAQFAEAHVDCIEWIRPDAGALSCARLRVPKDDSAALDRLHAALARHEVQLASGAWFHDDPRIIRIGFGMQRGEAFDTALAGLGLALRQAFSGT